MNQLPTRDSIGSKGCFRLLENAMDKQSIQVETTLTTGAPLPLPPHIPGSKSLMGRRPKAGSIHERHTQKIPRLLTQPLLPPDGLMVVYG